MTRAKSKGRRPNPFSDKEGCNVTDQQAGHVDYLCTPWPGLTLQTTQIGIGTRPWLDPYPGHTRDPGVTLAQPLEKNTFGVQNPNLSGILHVLENPTLCGTEIGQNGTLAVLAYAYCHQWECLPRVLIQEIVNCFLKTKIKFCLFVSFPICAYDFKGLVCQTKRIFENKTPLLCEEAQVPWTAIWPRTQIVFYVP